MKLITLTVVTTLALVVSAIAIQPYVHSRASILNGQGVSSPGAQSTSDSGVQYAGFQSAALGREMKFAIQLPPSYDSDAKRRFPAVYFLHGMFGSEREFERRGVAAAISKMRSDGLIGEFIIVSPAGENSFYVNAKNGIRYEDAVVQDLIPYIEKTYRIAPGSGNRAIQGISMGGFGALMIAFKHPEMFSSVTTHCAALFTELPKPTGDDRRSQFISGLIGKIFGDPPDDVFYQSVNPIKLAQTNAAAIKKSALKIHFDAGDKDRYGFQNTNKVLDDQLTGVGVTHEFHIFPGNHGWEYMISVADHSYGFLWKSFAANGKAEHASR